MKYNLARANVIDSKKKVFGYFLRHHVYVGKTRILLTKRKFQIESINQQSKYLNIEVFTDKTLEFMVE